MTAAKDGKRKVALPVRLNRPALKETVLYSEELGIRLKKKTDGEFFKWFLASLLFGGRITETIAKNTCRTFERYDLLNAEKILRAGWEFLVDPIMREGGYVRYDGRKSTQILTDCEHLITEYRASLTRPRDLSQNSKDLEARLLEFYGVSEAAL